MGDSPILRAPTSVQPAGGRETHTQSTSFPGSICDDHTKAVFAYNFIAASCPCYSNYYLNKY